MFDQMLGDIFICFVYLILFGLIGLLVTLIFGPFLLVAGLATEVLLIPYEWWFKRKMLSLGRCISRRELRRRGKDASGTIILDSPSFSWALTHIWWTNEDVFSRAVEKNLSAYEPGAPVADDLKCRAFDAWIWNEYLNPHSGRALLVEVWHCRHKVNRILKDCPHLKSLESYSGGKLLEEWCQEIRDQDNRDLALPAEKHPNA